MTCTRLPCLRFACPVYLPFVSSSRGLALRLFANTPTQTSPSSIHLHHSMPLLFAICQVTRLSRGTKLKYHFPKKVEIKKSCIYTASIPRALLGWQVNQTFSSSALAVLRVSSALSTTCVLKAGKKRHKHLRTQSVRANNNMPSVFTVLC